MSDSSATTGFVAPDLADLAPHFPGYEITSHIATGGMGAVYLAVQKSLDRNVALKILPPELSKDAAFRAGFEAEAKAMARLNHPNLIGVFDFGDVGGMLYIIMEFVPGKSLYHSAYGVAIDPQEVVRLVTGICHGLAHAHEHGILHRDIKPSNILLDLNAEPKIGDFGLARPADWTLAEGEEIFGTPHYTAPEVVNTPHAVDHRADIFSVGVVLHELLTAKLPADDPRPASAIIRCDPRFDAIIKRATQPLPAARYSSAKDMAADLQAIAASVRPRPVLAAGPAAPHRPARPTHHPVIRRQKKSSGAPVALVLVALAAAGAGVYFLNSTPPAPAPKASPPAVVVLPKSTGSTPAPVTSDTADEPEIPAPPVEETTQPPPPVVEETGPEMTADANDSTEEPVEPVFDVDGFLQRARRVMTDRAAPLQSAYRRRIGHNFQDFLVTLDREASRSRGSAAAVKERLDEEKATWTEEGRVPDRLPGALSSNADLVRIHSSYLSRQTGMDDTYRQELAKLATTYVDGLTQQSKRLQESGDTAAVELIRGEIQKTTRDADYFPDMVGTPAGGDE